MSNDKAKEGGLLTQKDLMQRWGVTPRTVQRHRKEFGLEPCDFTGINPVFRVEDVEAMEERRRAKRREFLNRQSKGKNSGRFGAILSLKEIRQKAGKRRAAK